MLLPGLNGAVDASAALIVAEIRGVVYLAARSYAVEI